MIFSLFQVIRGWEVSIADFGLGGWGSIPLLRPIFFNTAIFKIGSIISVPYQKLEKNAFEGLSQEIGKNTKDWI